MGSFSVKVLVSLLMLSSAGYAQEKCSLVFEKKTATKSYEISKTLDLNFVKDFVFNESNKYDVTMVSNRGPILNQDNWGLCHLYSLKSELEREYMQRHNGQNPNIAIHYNAFHHWYSRALESALSMDPSLKVPEGGWYTSTFAMIKSVGVMTNEQWAKLGGKTDVESAYKYQIEASLLKNLMLKSKSEQKLLEIFLKTDFTNTEAELLGGNISQNSHARELNIRRNYIKTIFNNGSEGPLPELKDFVQNKTKELAEDTTALTKKQIQVLTDLSKGVVVLSKMTVDEINQFKINLRKDIVRDVSELYASIFFGTKELPKEVLDTTRAIKLSQELFPEMHQTTLSIEVNEKMEAGPVKFMGRSNPDALNFTAPIEVLAAVIAQEVEMKNNGVWIGYGHNSEFVDNASGAMTFRGFKWNPSNPYITRAKRNKEQMYDGGHAVQIVGTIREKQTEQQKAAGEPGKLVGFKIQNSWGEKGGQLGIYTMDLDYFKAFFWGITIRDEEGKFSQKNLPEKPKKGEEPTFPKEIFFKKKN